jgi:hypothetical protein
MRRVLSSPGWILSLVLVAGVTSCKSTSDEEAPGRPRSARLKFADAWSAAVLDMGKFPIFPPTEDVYVGDIFAFSAPPSYGAGGSAEGLRTAATPRWSYLNVLSLLEEEYSQRPEWDELHASASNEEGKSLYRAGQVPVRHRAVAARSMMKTTLQLPDLEPFIPIEIAPLIEGPATPARFGVSVQVGDAEIYSLSMNRVVGQLLDARDEPDSPQYALKPEHLLNLSLVADPISGKAYLVVVTEVLYMRSIEATVRKRATPPADGENSEEVPPTATWRRQPDDASPGVIAIEQAKAMNEALGEPDEPGMGGTLHIVMATDEAVTLRRSWPYPMAVAIRGLTLEVDVATGSIVRMAPLGIELPELPEPDPEPEPEPEPTPDES